MNFKKLILTITLLILLGSNSYADHKCAVLAEIQVYDALTFKLKRIERGSTDFFVVTDQPHEDVKNLSIYNEVGELGTASVWTGTLLGTRDGDVIQAHANFKVNGVDGAASLLFSLDSTFSKALTVLEKNSNNEMRLMTIDLKCFKSL